MGGGRSLRKQNYASPYDSVYPLGISLERERVGLTPEWREESKMEAMVTTLSTGTWLETCGWPLPDPCDVKPEDEDNTGPSYGSESERS